MTKSSNGIFSFRKIINNNLFAWGQSINNNFVFNYKVLTENCFECILNLFVCWSSYIHPKKPASQTPNIRMYSYTLSFDDISFLSWRCRSWKLEKVAKPDVTLRMVSKTQQPPTISVTDWLTDWQQEQQCYSLVVSILKAGVLTTKTTFRKKNTNNCKNTS